jgi:Zn-dependent M28 family amino/carboxypeptidase
LLLEMARVLTVADAIPCHVLLAFVDGEECAKAYGPKDGLHGSRRLAGRLRAAHIRQRITGVVVVDMIGDRDLRVGIPRNCSASLVTATFDAAKVVGTRPHFSLSRSSILDDHVPFIQAGFRAVDLIDFQFGSAPGKNDYWHTTEDTLDKISAESLSIVGRTTVEIVNQLAGGAAPSR